VTWASLNTGQPPYCDRLELHRVVLRANPGRVQQEAENFGVGPSGPPREQIQCEKHSNGSGQTIEQIEDAGAHDERKEKQFSLGSEDREGMVE
jgi:hypothetical protein